MHPFNEEAQRNYDILRDCLCELVVYKTRVATSNAAKRKSRARRNRSQSNSSLTEFPREDAEDLAEFIDVIRPCQTWRGDWAEPRILVLSF